MESNGGKAAGANFAMSIVIYRIKRNSKLNLKALSFPIALIKWRKHLEERPRLKTISGASTMTESQIVKRIIS